jgi:hypothetical protein
MLKAALNKKKYVWKKKNDFFTYHTKTDKLGESVYLCMVTPYTLALKYK